MIRRFPWNAYDKAVTTYNISEAQRYSTQLLLGLVPFVLKAPLIPVNTSDPSPPVHVITDQNCTLLPTPRRVGVLWQFGFDVDALEIHLHEFDGLVDRFFLLESIKPHSRLVTDKPLLWDRLKFDKRFEKFSEKIVHFILDDGDLPRNASGGIWTRENLQESLRWEKFMQWNKNASDSFKERDILGFGDVDEVPNRDNVAYFKYCELPGDPIDVGIWFPFDGINTVFKTDHYIEGHPITLGDPTFWTLGKAMKHFNDTGKHPSRMRGKSGTFILGGTHLSRYAYPPFQMIKVLTGTEANWTNLKLVVEAGFWYSQGNITNGNSVLNTIPFNLQLRVTRLEEFRKQNENEVNSVVKLPWFLKANINRYPAFNKMYDSRLG